MMRLLIKNIPLIFLSLLLIILCCGRVRAFVPFSPAIQTRAVEFPFLQQTKASSTSIDAARNNTKSGSSQPNRPAATEVSKNPNENIPMQQQQAMKVQNRLQAMQDRNSKGEQLTQEYCDSILGLCVAAEEWCSVLEVLDVMKDQGINQQHSTYQASIQSCFEMSNGAAAQEILEAMEKASVGPSPEDLGLAIAAMCRNNKQKSGWWNTALDLLMYNPSPNIPIAAYDAVFSCMVDERKWKEALRLLREMEGGSTATTIEEKRLHPEPTLSTYLEVIECCVAANKVDQALQLIKSMIDRGNTPSVDTFELVISALSRNLQWRRAKELLNLMDKLDVPKTVLTYNTIISACCKSKEAGVAKGLLTQMKREGVKPSIVSYNSVLSVCAGANRWRDSMAVLDQLNRDPNCTPDIYTYTNAIRACAKAGKIDRALVLYDVAKHKKLTLDSYFYAAIIEACGKSNQWRRALDMLEQMKTEGIAPNGYIYSITITACGYGKQWQKSLDLLDEMRKEGIRINLITYNSAITSLARAAKQPSGHTEQAGELDAREELWIRALQLLDQMKSDGIKPDGFSFASAISCCGASGRWNEAVNLLEVMRKGGPRLRPNKVAYTSAITACGRAGEFEEAMRLFRLMKDEGLNPDRIAYNAMFNSLKRANQADIAYELWKEMCGKFSGNEKKAAAAPDRWTSPDIITLTDLIATLSNHTLVDEVFADAVKRGIFFSNMLDSTFEIDLSGMSFPVARAACRFALNRAFEATEKGEKLEDLSIITGVGAAMSSKTKNQKNDSPDKNNGSRKVISLREYIQEVLRDDFKPSIQSFVPKRAQGSVEIDKSILQGWIKQMKR